MKQAIISTILLKDVRCKLNRCKGGCLRCMDDSDNCLECPVDKYTLQEQVITHTTRGIDLFAGILGLFFGVSLPTPKISVTEIKMMNKCLDKCPKVYGEKELPVIIHEDERKCLVKSDDGQVQRQILPTQTDDDDIPKYISKLKMTYDEAIKNIEKNTKNTNNPDQSQECHFNGILKKEIRGDLDSYYICRCSPGYMGDNCQISRTLYDDVQQKITNLLKKIKAKYTKLDNESRNSLLGILISLNKFKINRPNIELIIAIVQTFVGQDKHLENKKKYYLLYDSLLLNLFDLREDLRKRPQAESLYIIDVNDEMSLIYIDVDHVLIMLEKSLEDLNFANSFLDKNSKHYIGLQTYSYILAEYRYSNYNKNDGFLIANPNIDTSFNNVNNNYMYLSLKSDDKNALSGSNLQIMNIASPLFIEKIKMNRKDMSTKPTLVSNIVYLRNIDPKKPHMKIRMSELGVDVVRIKFSMNFIPFVELEMHHLYCMGYSVTPGILNVRGNCISYDDDAEEATCEYELTGEFENYYFGLEVNS